MMRYWPLPSVTPVRTFSINTGLVTSTVTPGRTALDESVTTPVTDGRMDCPYAHAGISARHIAKAQSLAPITLLATFRIACLQKSYIQRCQFSTAAGVRAGLLVFHFPHLACHLALIPARSTSAPRR